MSNTRLLLAATLACVLSGAGSGSAETAGSAAAETAGVEAPQASARVLLDTIRANRRALVAVNLDLGSEEAAGFWPLYDRYQAELDAIGDRLATIIEEYITSFRDLSDDKALQLVEGYLATEAERVKVRSTYLAEFARILPGRTVARLYQIENKMDAVLRYDLAATIPVVDEKREAPVE